MDAGSSSSSVQQMAPAAPHQFFPDSETDGAAVDVDEGMDFVGGEGASGSGGGDSVGKRKRGRPKKQTKGEAPGQKRGRGRPRGSGKFQASEAFLSGTALESAGSNFIPHTVAVHTGENVVQRICSFAQSSSQSICVLSASGSVSSVELLRTGSFNGTVRCEGQFEVITLNGSYAYTGMGEANEKNFALSVQLANSDGSLIAGAVGSSLIAGASFQLIIATFKQKSKEKGKTRKPSNAVAESANRQSPAAGEANALAAVSPAPAPQVGALENFMDVPDLSHVAPQPFDWSALQPSSSFSQHVMRRFNPGMD